MRLSPLLLLGLLALLTGCHSLSPIQRGGMTLAAMDDPQAAFLVGAVGIAGTSAVKPDQARLFLRQRGQEEFINVGIMDDWAVKTSHQIRQPDGSKATLFALPLKPGQYELYTLSFHFGGSWITPRETFSVPLQIEAGKTYYLGDFRAECVWRKPARRRDNGTACRFIRHQSLEAQQAQLRQLFPQIGTVEALNLRLAPAAPFIIDMRILELMESLRSKP